MRSLRILAHRGKVNTISFMTYLDFLTHKFHDDYDNDPKTNSLKISQSRFTFHFLNNCDDQTKVDVDYYHTFHFIKHGTKFDALILHAYGTLVRDPQSINSIDNTSPFIKYQNEYYLIMPEPCNGDMRNTSNHILDRVQCSLPPMKFREEQLDFHYRIIGEANLKDDDVYVIYPRNYGKKFNKEAQFDLTYDQAYLADIQLLALPYGSIKGGGLKYVSQFKCEDGGKHYTCTVKSLNDSYLYLIAIKHRTPM